MIRCSVLAWMQEELTLAKVTVVVLWCASLTVHGFLRVQQVGVRDVRMLQSMEYMLMLEI